MTTIRSASLVLTAALLAACAGGKSEPAAPAKVADGIIVAPNGMTLYTLDRDSAGSGKSACYGPCIANWPAFAAASDAKAGGDWSLIARDDGIRQWAFRGKPLYFWTKDTKPGERSGDGINGVWHVVKP